MAENVSSAIVSPAVKVGHRPRKCKQAFVGGLLCRLVGICCDGTGGQENQPPQVLAGPCRRQRTRTLAYHHREPKTAGPAARLVQRTPAATPQTAAATPQPSPHRRCSRSSTPKILPSGNDGMRMPRLYRRTACRFGVCRGPHLPVPLPLPGGMLRKRCTPRHWEGWPRACDCRHISIAHSADAARHRDATDQRPPARNPVQRAFPAHCGCPFCRPLCRLGCRRDRGVVPRCGPRVLCRNEHARAGKPSREPSYAWRRRGDDRQRRGHGRAAATAHGAFGRAVAAPLDIVFLDPPYDQASEYVRTLTALGADDSVLSADALVVAEHARKSPLADVYGRLHRTRTLLQGDAALSFYAVQAAGAEREA